jgi:urea transport system permease protein
MNLIRRTCRWLPAFGFAQLLCSPALALTNAEALALAQGDTDQRIEALAKAAAQTTPGMGEFVQALLDDEVKVAGERVLLVRGAQTLDATTLQATVLPAGAEEVVNNNRMRGALGAVRSALRLFSSDTALRTQAVSDLEKNKPDAAQLPLLDKALAAETNPALKQRLRDVHAAVVVTTGDKAARLNAAKALAQSAQPTIKSLLQERLATGGEADPEIRAALQRALSDVAARLSWGERLGVLFTGISLGSVLLLVALGLAITYGLMGVINMAHGELMMIGAYATYWVQGLFRQHLPQWFDAYVLAAIPVSFAVAALVGAVLERGVIRWLYGRPLETLLATWGISLVLMQAVRSIFGAQNVAVENPAWLSGGIELLPNLVLPLNRIAIIGFAFAVLLAVALLVARTRLGLFVRGVTQNRRMAACTGVDTARVDTMAFSLGAGLAGLAGCALSQIGNVGPDLGQSYIVDAFMVVVLGGVGQLAGTVIAALGLGVLAKLLEGWSGAVLAKIMVLVFIVVFIQKRPQGLFAMKGRSAEA